MSGVRNAINEMKVQQDSLQSQMEIVSAKIKQAQDENYELEQIRLSLERKETFLQQKIQKTLEHEKAKLDTIQKLQAQYPGVNESSESLTAKSNGAYEKREKLLEELKKTQEQANKNDMMFEEVMQRVTLVQQNCDRMENRANLKEAEVKRLEEGFKDAISQVEVFKSKDHEDDTHLMNQVAEVQKKLEEVIRTAETAEREGEAFKKSVESVQQQIAKQREENEKIREEMKKMNEILEISEP